MIISLYANKLGLSIRGSEILQKWLWLQSRLMIVTRVESSDSVKNVSRIESPSFSTWLESSQSHQKSWLESSYWLESRYHCWLFFHNHFRWLAEVWVRSEHPYKPLSLSVPQSLSLSCASSKCNHPVCIWSFYPQTLSLNKHSRWVFLSSYGIHEFLFA